MNTTRYRLVLYLHLVMIIADIFINSFTDILKVANVVELILYVLQDTLILFDIIALFLMFFSTFVFQAGFVWNLISKFRYGVCISCLYLCLSIACHTWKLTLGWSNRNFIWPVGFRLLFAMQRTVAVPFYHFYSQTVLHLSNPKFYKRATWSQMELTDSK